MDSSIQFQITGSIAKILLNRPATGNAVTLEMFQALLEVVVRALVCTSRS